VPGRARAQKRSSRRSPLARAKGVLGAGPATKKGKGAKGSRKRPAMIAVLGGLGAAATAFGMRRGAKQRTPAAS
jgi:hypothetical protein